MSARASGALATTCAVALASCVSESREITLRDRDILMPTLRLQVGTKEEDGTPGPVALTAEITRADGSASSTSDYQLTSTQLLGRARLSDSPRFRTFMLFGFEHVDFKAEENGGTTPLHISHGAFGLCPGLEFALTIHGPFEAYARGTASAMLPASTSVRAEVGLRYAPVAELEVLGGYRWWDFDFEDNDAYRTDIVDINTEGIFVGMGLRL